jgi:hypothetical protein
MSKVSKPFQFNMPVTRKVVQDTRLKTLHVGDLVISGKAYLNPSGDTLHERFSADIDTITWNGTDVRELLEVATDMLIADIHEAAVHHASTIFNQQVEA